MRVRFGHTIYYALMTGVMMTSAISALAQAPAQQPQQAGQRGAPPAAQRGGPIGPIPGARGTVTRLQPGALPAGAPHPDALPIDLFTTKNFYKDEQLWSDPILIWGQTLNCLWFRLN